MWCVPELLLVLLNPSSPLASLMSYPAPALQCIDKAANAVMTLQCRLSKTGIHPAPPANAHMCGTYRKLVSEMFRDACQVIDGVVNIDTPLEEEAVLHLHSATTVARTICYFDAQCITAYRHSSVSHT